ncbi:MAG: zinc-binding dehydrogenase [Methanomassiliicoccus sp.]|nr:zinc-binding dehydrogenase [Methanomassiliicoccus sp.]
MAKEMVLSKQGSTDYLEMRDYPTPSAGPGAVVADVVLCGVCGTDTHQVMGWLPIPVPHALGHEWFGRVRELGEGVEADATGQPLSTGDRIASGIGISRPDWYSRNLPDRPNVSSGFEEVGISMTHTADDPPHFWGAFAEHVYLPGYFPIYKLPPGMDDRELVLVEPIAVATRAFKRAQGSAAGYTKTGVGVDPSQTVVVQGMGPVGMCHALVCNLFGMTNIIGIDKVPERLEKGKRMGLTDAIDMNEVDSIEDRQKQVKKLSGGEGADIVFETAGHPSAFEESFQLVRKGGCIVEVGNAADSGKAQLSPFTDVCQKDVDVLGSFGYSGLEYRTAMATMVKAKQAGVPFGEIVGEVRPLEELPEQIQRQGEAGVPGRIAIQPR